MLDRGPDWTTSIGNDGGLVDGHEMIDDLPGQHSQEHGAIHFLLGQMLAQHSPERPPALTLNSWKERLREAHIGFVIPRGTPPMYVDDLAGSPHHDAVEVSQQSEERLGIVEDSGD